MSPCINACKQSRHRRVKCNARNIDVDNDANHGTDDADGQQRTFHYQRDVTKDATAISSPFDEWATLAKKLLELLRGDLEDLALLDEGFHRRL